jgi:hypothetical protein
MVMLLSSIFPVVSATFYGIPDDDTNDRFEYNEITVYDKYIHNIYTFMVLTDTFFIRSKDERYSTEENIYNSMELGRTYLVRISKYTSLWSDYRKIDGIVYEIY